MNVALTIAGSDSGAGAGIQADLKTFAAHGVYGTCAITAITAQNTVGVSMAETLSPRLVRAQIESVVSDMAVHAAKTGMLASAAIVQTVAQAVLDFRLDVLVVDPVMLAKSGDALLDGEALDAVTRLLLPLATVVTPNLPEAEALARRPVVTTEDRREAARQIVGLGARAVVIKGGHAPSDDIEDLLYDGREFSVFVSRRVPGRDTHGTGCTFSAALTAHLALGRSLADAIPLAQRYVAEAIRRAPHLGAGHGPMRHVWDTCPDARPDDAR
jgi:hydroxymethylpyrimidine/phosphomethylpyrimidine kinase